MAEINKIHNLETNQTYQRNTVKKSSGEFSSYLGETKKLDDIFNEAAEKYNVPVHLLKAIGKAESNFNEKAVSRCGAQGIMQLMPATAKSLGVTDSFDPEQNIMGGSKYIADLLKRYDGDTSLALAAYNAGSGNVKKYGGIPPFEETQNYVKKVMNFMKQDIDTGVTTTVTSGTNNASRVPFMRNEKPVEYIKLEDQASKLNEMDDYFTYDDYLKFLDIFLKEEKEKSKEEEQSVSYATKDINFSAPVINLLKQHNIL